MPSPLERRPWIAASIYMPALGAFFCSTYGFADWVTDHRSHVPSIAFGWEHHIPFLAWTIVPYWSIDPLYCLSFFVCRTRTELTRHVRRLLAAQILCVGAFLLFPLRFTFVRPQTHGAFGQMFQALAGFDGPFNQAPSLHLSLAVILAAGYSDHLKGPARWLLWAWFALIGASALTTYQHHFIDIPTGIWVGLFCCAAFSALPERGLRQTRSLNMSGLYLAGFLLTAALAVRIGSWGWWLLWPAGSCLIVSAIYRIGDPGLFRKYGGRLHAATQCLLAPHTMAAWLNSRWWTRHDSRPVEIADGVWLGRLPSRLERDACGILSMVDLTAELPVRADDIEYRNVPMLDLVQPTAAQLDLAVAAIESLEARRPTLVCCALGYSRSPAAVAAWLVATGRARNMYGAIAMIGLRRKRIVLFSKSARTGRAARLGLPVPIPLAPGVAARGLSGNSARTGRAARLGRMLPSPLPPGVAARALNARRVDAGRTI